MRFLAPLSFLFFLGCGSDKTADDGGTTTDTGVKDAGVDASKDSSGVTDSGGDAATLDGYYAWGNAGAMNRLYVYYADHANNVCFVLFFKSNNGMNMTAVTVPTGWELETVGTGVFDNAQACSPYFKGTATLMQNLSSSGSVNWSGTNVPQTLWDVTVTLNFMPTNWAPGSFDFKVQNLNVTMF